MFAWVSGERPFVNTATVGLTGKVIGNDLFSIGNGAKTIGKSPESIGSPGFERE